MAKLKSSARAKAGASTDSSDLKAKAEQFSRSLAGSAQQVWSAGVGAFARAQTEGTRMFETLVKEGMNLERNTRKHAAGKVDAMRDAVEGHVGNARERAADTWDRLEKVFEDRVQRSLTRLGVPGREEIATLIDRVDQLNRELRKLAGVPTRKAAPAKSAAAKKAPKQGKAKKVASRKPAVKKAAAGKAASKKPVAKKAATRKASNASA
jgi:poly(hydroxyalkanoate) granule-associated protein